MRKIVIKRNCTQYFWFIPFQSNFEYVPCVIIWTNRKLWEVNHRKCPRMRHEKHEETKHQSRKRSWCVFHSRCFLWTVNIAMHSSTRCFERTYAFFIAQFHLITTLYRLAPIKLSSSSTSKRVYQTTNFNCSVIHTNAEFDTISVRCAMPSMQTFLLLFAQWTIPYGVLYNSFASRPFVANGCNRFFWHARHARCINLIPV